MAATLDQSPDTLFKLGRFFHNQKKYDEALSKYREVCDCLSTQIRASPDTKFDYHLIPLSIAKAVELYRLRRDSNKGFALLAVERKILALMESHPNSVLPPPELLPLLDEMDSAFSLVTDPKGVLNQFLEEKSKQEQAKAQQNMDLLTQLADLQQKRYERSRMYRLRRWAETNQGLVLILLFTFVSVCIALLAVFAIRWPTPEERKEYAKIKEREKQMPEKEKERAERFKRRNESRPHWSEL
jgi:hypothetical protein